VEGVVITGGEPAIYADLPDLIKRLKNTGILVKLDTNGSNPGQLKELLLAGLLDYVALDIKTSLPKYNLVTDLENIAEAVFGSIDHLMRSQVPYEFRTTCVPGIVDKENIAEIGELVKGAKRYCLQQFRPVITFDEKFQNVKPYSREDLEGFQKILKDFVETVEIRGL
jgi:pyruvate formate lyase activating enzyme